MEKLQGIHDLLKNAYLGNKSSEDELFELIRARISNLLRYKIWGASRSRGGLTEDARDLLQQIMMELYDQYKKNKLPTDDLLKWIFTIMNRRIVDYFRRKKTTSLEDIPYPLLDEEQMERVLEAKELHRLIGRALARVPDKCKKIIQALLYESKKDYIEKQSHYQEKNTIYSDIHRCRRHFSDMLKLEGYER
ncbi:sigma-70 family RNA polymerase sigma factor [candidate division KSB1 bacterium]|nr:sigma-70 family RNA polymerase sigma factor [candidate division KSB1 bacterium]